jgi:hypothetical protein
MQKQNIPDLPNSTYWWIINLNQNDPRNKVPKITGYSKFQNQAESNDKIRCLMSKIFMLQKNGYLERSNSIEIYKRLGALPNKQNDRLILQLQKNDYSVPEDLLFKMPFELKTFLSKFYECLVTGVPVKNLIPLPEKDFSKDDLFQIHKYHFPKLKDLYDWCEKQIANGEARDMVLKFYANYSQKHLLQ